MSRLPKPDPVVLLAIGQSSLRCRLALWLKDEAVVVFAASAEDACGWLRSHAAPAAVIVNTTLAPRLPPARPDAAPGVEAALDVYFQAGCVGGNPAVVALLPEGSGDAQARFLETHARLFDERCAHAHQAVLQLLREWKVSAHAAGAVAAIVLREASRARLTPPQTEALALVAREVAHKEAAERLGISLGAYKHRINGAQKKLGVSAVTVGERIRAEALAAGESNRPMP